MNNRLETGAIIGILGGGQLGRMLSIAASRLGLRTHIFEPQPNPPAGDVAYRVTTADYTDTEALVHFASSVDVITYEFENVPTAALNILESIRPVRPSRKALTVSQDRVDEKEFLKTLGLSVAPFAPINSLNDLTQAINEIGTPSILKTRRFGYDGKGQQRIQTTTGMSEAFDALNGSDAILEGFVDFQREVSVIAARGLDGAVICYDLGENVHKNGILDTTTVPAEISQSQQIDAALIAGKIVNALDYIGVMGIELFVTTQGLIVNEIAPRVHNSGHWTQNGCAVDQFEQHIRAIAGWPLGDGQRHSNVVMKNLIGDDVSELDQHKDAAVHLYGKTEVKAGRKMGHTNTISPKT